MHDVITLINGAKKIPDDQKIGLFLRDKLDPTIIWEEISRNIDLFSCEVDFDGGYRLGALTNNTATTYDSNIVMTFANYIRDIRNALSHGRDIKTTNVITPTERNFQQLKPWASLISIVAQDIMLYRKLP